MESALIRLLLLWIICVLLAIVSEDAAAPTESLIPGCDSTTCKLPECLCMNTTAPLGLNANEIPHLIFLTFDDTISDWMVPMYERILYNRRNPNGCPISITFYVTHDWGTLFDPANENIGLTNYQQVNAYYNQGHEIASHSLTHVNDTKYWAEGDVDRWTKEVDQQRDVLSRYANIPKNRIQGHRAPYLQSGGDSMFQALKSLNMSYDSTMPTSAMSPPIWPFTLDYGVTHDCVGEPCTNGVYPGVWNFPSIFFEGNDGKTCIRPDQCTAPATANETFNYFFANFQRFTLNRTPFGVFQHVFWFKGGNQILDGFIQFLDYLATLDYVYIVPVSKGIEWLRNPLTLDQLKDNDIFACPAVNNPAPCSQPQSCYYSETPAGGPRTMESCIPCPPVLPWLDNVEGNL